jgi:acyl carrier protein
VELTQQADDTLRQRVIDSMVGLLPQVLKREVPVAGEATRLFDELGLGSAVTLELLLELEDALGIQIDVEDIDRADLETVGTLASFVAGHALVDG